MCAVRMWFWLCAMRLARGGGVRGIQDGGGQWEFLPFGADRGGQSEDLSLCMCRAVPIDESL